MCQLLPGASSWFIDWETLAKEILSYLKVERQSPKQRHPEKVSLRRDSMRMGRETETERQTQ